MFPAAMLDTPYSILPDVDAKFKDVYDISKTALLDAVNSVMEVVGMDKRQMRYAYSLTVPLLENWKPGQTIPEGACSQETFILNVVRWGKKISWPTNNRLDEQIPTILDNIERLAKSAKTLRVRVFFQMLEGTADDTLLDIALLDPCPDGAVLFSTTNGSGDARFGAVDGNLYTGSGITEAAITADIWGVRKQFQLFKHTDGKTPLIDPEELDTMIYFVHPSRELMFRRVLQRSRQSDGTATGGLSNIINESGINWEIWATSYLTDELDWYAFVKNARTKALVVGERNNLETKMFDGTNSETAFDNDTESYRVKLREGYGYALPYCVIKVNNT